MFISLRCQANNGPRSEVGNGFSLFAIAVLCIPSPPLAPGVFTKSFRPFDKDNREMSQKSETLFLDAINRGEKLASNWASN